MWIVLFSLCGLWVFAEPLLNQDGKVVGYATISQKGSGLLLQLTVNDLSPGWHALHIHEVGACDDYANGFKKSGSHLNPHNKAHGVFDHAGYHAGDLANVYVDLSGEAQIEQIVPGLTPQDYRSLFVEQGPALIMHAKPDDYSTQPVGTGGDRIACAVLPSAKMTASN